MKLRHIPLKGLTRYSDVSALQEHLVRSLLASKHSEARFPLQSVVFKADKHATNYKPSTLDETIPSNPNAIPPPTVITAQFHPTYTTGRRDVGKLSDTEIAYLSAGTGQGKAEFHAALRGGQTTYHGPGQMTAYPIVDLKRHGLTARCYVNLLEEMMIKTCARHGIRAFRTANTGVWVSEDKKIGAIGVHLRRHVSSHGVSLNVRDTVQPWFDRIVACGLEDKKATSFQAEMPGRNSLFPEQVADDFVEELAEALDGVDGMVKVRAEWPLPDGRIVSSGHG